MIAAETPVAQQRPRILFVSPPLPYPKAAVEDDNIDYFYYRNTMGQGLFQLRQMHSWHPLHFLAQNLPVDSVVLENPTWSEFTHEVERGGFDVVAISFTVVLARKVLDMVTWLRDQVAGPKIVLGGYGTVIFDENFGIEKEIAGRVDHICRGEGLAFMRSYLAERWGVTEAPPLTQALVPSTNSLFRTRLSLYEQLAFVGSLGCTNGCPFCATSAHYGRHEIAIAHGRILYQQVAAQARRHPRVQSAIIYKENFLEDRDQVIEFMQAMEADQELVQRPLLLTVFSSIRSISQYSVEELLRCGIGTIFVGVESFRGEILKGEELAKRSGREVGAVFQELHQVGINTLGSMIVGWDGHTLDNIGQELDAFVALNPTFYQIVPLHPVPGTRLWQTIKAEGRLIEDYRYEDDGAAKSNFHFKHFSHDEVDRLVIGTYHRLVQEGGPWPFRLVDNLQRGAGTLSTAESPALKQRARAYRKMLGPLLPLALLSGLLFWGTGFQARFRHTLAALWSKSPALVVRSALLAAIALPALAALYLFGALRFWLSPAGDQPDTIRREYGNAPIHARPVEGSQPVREPAREVERPDEQP